MTRDQYIDEVLQGFDFDMVMTTMQATNWRWRQPDGGLAIPSRDQVVANARELLEKAWNGHTWVMCGGLFAEFSNIDGGTLGLRFVVEHSDVLVSVATAQP